MNKRYARFTLAVPIAISAFWSPGVQANGIGMGSLENQIYSFGGYSSAVGMRKQVQQKLIDDHFLFAEGDAFLKWYIPNMVVSE